MARVVLIDAAGWQDGLFNLGLAYIAAGLKDAGHQAEVIDLNNHFRKAEEAASLIGERKPDYVGFSVKSATFANALEIHRELAARHPEIPCVYGGPHVTISGPALLDETPPAWFIRGEAERSLARFISLHSSGATDFGDVPGIMYRDASGAAHETPVRFCGEIDSLPLPDFTVFDTFASFRTYPLLTSRGCPYRCTYCSVPAISGRHWVHRSPESVMRELDHVLNEMRIRSVVIVDDNFTIHKRRAMAICQAIIDRGYDFIWSCGNGIRADRIWPDLARLMYRAGCREVAFGVESLDSHVFGRLGKGEDIGQIRRGIEIVKEAGIKVTGFFMIGLPGSTYRKDRRTLALARRLGLDNYYFGLTVPYPGTQLWEWAQKEARFLIPWQNSYHISEVFRDGLDRARLEPVFETPEYPAEERRKMFRMAQESKTRAAARSLRSVDRVLRSAPGRPIAMIRSSRRDHLFEALRQVRPMNPHICLWKGKGDFPGALKPASWEMVRVPGDGLLDAADASADLRRRLEDSVIVFDVPGGSLDKFGNVVQFARALRPRQLMALLGEQFHSIPLEAPRSLAAGTGC